MHELVFDAPARVWNEALPLGNGSLGAMVFGGVERERLQLNIDSLWSGFPRHQPNPRAADGLRRARACLERGDFAGADAACHDLMGAYSESYLPLGDLHLEFRHGDVAAEYRRSLELDTALSRVSYRIGQECFSRETFISAPDHVLAMRLTSDCPGGLDLDIHLTGRLEWGGSPDGLSEQDRAGWLITGRCPETVAPSYCEATRPVVYAPPAESKALRWAAGMRLVLGAGAGAAVRGRVESMTNGLRVRGADDLVLYLAAATTWRGHQAMPGTDAGEAVAAVRAVLEAAVASGWDGLRLRQAADHQALFGRVAIDLGAATSAEMPLDRRIAAAGAADPGLVALLFQYGRYLLISSSRPGSLTANLQGIWNDEVRPPWSCNYTININTEMNYWPAWSTNLAECARPVLDFLPALANSGEPVAQDFLGCAGWAANHNSDAWAHAAPVGGFGQGDPVWSFWPMGGIWMSALLWEEWRFGCDLSFLRRTLWPILSGAARFALDWLVACSDGSLTTAPSTSPEHRFRTADGGLAAVGRGSTLDLLLIGELFDHCLEAADRLELSDAALVARVRAARVRLQPVGIRLDGTLEEWSDGQSGEDPGHRHLSHLYGIFPGDSWDAETDPDYWQAALRSLDARGSTGTGWSLAWKICLRARFGQGDLAWGHLRELLRPAKAPETGGWERGGVYPNLLDACPPFQIDGNFGVTAGIALMLVQGDGRIIRLLPALPGAWPDGSVRGLRLRDGITVDLEWAHGRLVRATLVADRDCRPELRVDCRSVRLSLPAGAKISLDTELAIKKSQDSRSIT